MQNRQVISIELRKFFAYRKEITSLLLLGILFVFIYASAIYLNFEENLATIQYTFGKVSAGRLFVFSFARLSYFFNSLLTLGLVVLFIKQENYTSWKHFTLHPYPLPASFLAKQLIASFLTLLINLIFLLPIGLAGLYAIPVLADIPVSEGYLHVFHVIVNNSLSAVLYTTILLYTGLFLRKTPSVIYLIGIVTIALSYTGLPPCPGYTLLRLKGELIYYPASLFYGLCIAISIHFVSALSEGKPFFKIT